MSIPTSAEAQLAAVMQQAGQPAPQTVSPQTMQQSFDPNNPQVPEVATMPTMDQVSGETPLPPQQMAQPQQQQNYPQQQGIAQQPPQQDQNNSLAQQLNMMHGRLRAANDQIKQLQNQGQAQHVQPAPFQQVQPQTVVQASDITSEECLKYYSKEYIDEWGDDAVKQQLAAQKNVAAAMATQVQPQQSNNDYQKLASQFFHSELSRIVPNYMQVEGTQQFETWLNNNVEPLSGFSYKELLNDAYDEGDVNRASSVFDMYLRQGAGNPAYQPQQMQMQPQYQEVPQHQYPAQTIMPSASGAPMPNGNGMPAQSMDVHQWQAAMADLPSQGLSPLEMANKQQELTAMFKRGQVSGTTGSAPVMPAW